MKKSFPTRLAAIDWIAANAKDETHFEILREQLNYNYIYFQLYFIDLNDTNDDVSMSGDLSEKRFL